MVFPDPSFPLWHAVYVLSCCWNDQEASGRKSYFDALKAHLVWSHFVIVLFLHTETLAKFREDQSREWRVLRK